MCKDMFIREHILERTHFIYKETLSIIYVYVYAYVYVYVYV